MVARTAPAPSDLHTLARVAPVNTCASLFARPLPLPLGYGRIAVERQQVIRMLCANRLQAEAVRRADTDV
ncbi:hypothetical protein Asi03nite_02300 [Actinoplanes siamensis]|uniref:Uncharacterized protein n=1 Tax=Actinoplanes siamensis TaxID=1223317 RepID=A0A919K827_9ACTN|nr:hypothetical protein Asi03nite_02300 [Actinoplanes siamensis]